MRTFPAVLAALCSSTMGCSSDHGFTVLDADSAPTPGMVALADQDEATPATADGDPGAATPAQLQRMVWLVTGGIDDEALALARRADADAAMDPDGDGVASTQARCPQIEVIADVLMYQGTGCVAPSGALYTGQIRARAAWNLGLQTYEGAVEVMEPGAAADLAFDGWAEQTDAGWTGMRGQLARTEEALYDLDGTASGWLTEVARFLSHEDDSGLGEGAVLSTTRCTERASDGGPLVACATDGAAAWLDGIGTVEVQAEWGTDDDGVYGHVALVGVRTVRIDLAPSGGDCPTYSVDDWPAGSLCD